MLDKIKNKDIREDPRTKAALEIIENRQRSWQEHLVRMDDIVEMEANKSVKQI